MLIRDTLLPEFDREMAITRVKLERVPEKDVAWKPHPKCFDLGCLAVHVATLPGWLHSALTTTEVDINPPGGPAFAPPPFTTTQTLLEYFDANVARARAALEKAADADFSVSWSLKSAGRTYFTSPRAVVVRSFVLNHLIHHRAQLGVYLRLRDVPLPAVYGPSADAGM